MSLGCTSSSVHGSRGVEGKKLGGKVVNSPLHKLSRAPTRVVFHHDIRRRVFMIEVWFDPVELHYADVLIDGMGFVPKS